MTVNLIANMLREEVPVGLIGLDEPTPGYVAKLASAITGHNDAWLEDNWDAPQARKARKDYRTLTKGRFVLSSGTRPDTKHLSRFLDMAEAHKVERPKVVFIDYLSLMARNKYDGGENQRMMRLVEKLQVWKKEEGLVVVALHQVGRELKTAGLHYHGDTPMTDSMLKYAGEEVADVVLATYRPALSPIGNMEFDEALEHMPQSWDHDKQREVWARAVKRVEKYQHSTFLQLLKNRPGTKLNFRGIELESPNSSMRMAPIEPRVGDDMRLREVSA